MKNSSYLFARIILVLYLYHKLPYRLYTFIYVV